MRLLTGIGESLLHLVFPHTCPGCGSDVLPKDQALCLRCLDALPLTRFEQHPANPVATLFWGRLPLAAATAHYYFTKESLVQRLMHRFKYKGDKALGAFLGRQVGVGLLQSPHFATVDALVPLPLFGSKEQARGYNQATVLCEGMAEGLQKPVLKNSVVRTAHTDSQTKKTRLERWQNMEGRFEVAEAERLAGKHLLLVDDVVTTGATLEACGRALLAVEGVRLSIATLCVASE